MKKKLILFIFLLVSLIGRTQTVQPQPDTIPSPLDKLSYDELMLYYINEPEPPQFYKGPIEAGDSIYKQLNPLTIPTQTVDADALLHFSRDIYMGDDKQSDTVNRQLQSFKPKVALGMGRLGFYGDLYERHYQSFLTARPAFNLDVSQRLNRYLQLNFTVLFGKLGANEWTSTRHENFQSEIRAGGVNLLYDFGNFIPDQYAIRPFVSFGVQGFEFLSKTDLKDKDGNLYHYWSDGSIKDKPEGAPDAQFARDLVRDYKYETDIRERNADGFGKYPERAWAFPIGAGVEMKVTDRVDFKINFQYFFTTTDYIDGITNKSAGSRMGTKGKDKFTYTSVSLQYDLIAMPKKKVNPVVDTMSNSFWLAFDQEDMDKDGVPDLRDDCQGTPPGVAVDLKGCPLDDDLDGIPNYRDDELTTPPGTPVNERGVGQTDDYWAAWYASYLNDSAGVSKSTEYVGNFFTQGTAKKHKKEKKDAYAVELARYKGSIPTDELAFYLSIGDISSTTLDDGTTVVYTAGNYDKLAAAVKRRDEFRSNGTKNAGISRISGNNVIQIPDEELDKLLSSELKDLMAINIDKVVDSSKVVVSDPGTGVDSDKNFGQEDIVYRVQLGAFKNKISTSVFNTSAGVLELKTGDNVYRYVTKGYKTIEEAAAVRADLVLQGYSDAFVTSYKAGKRIALNQTKATVDKSYKEDLSEDKIFSSVNKKLVTFKIQLGPLKRPALEGMMDEKVKVLGSNSEKQTTATGSIRYTSGNFNNFDEAEKYRQDLEGKGFTDAFIIATFRNEIISIQEALELMK